MVERRMVGVRAGERVPLAAVMGGWGREGFMAVVVVGRGWERRWERMVGAGRGGDGG